MGAIPLRNEDRLILDRYKSLKRMIFNQMNALSYLLSDLLVLSLAIIARIIPS